MSASPRVAMVAGETSGDLLAGLLLDGLQAQWPGLQAQGIGGPQMQRRGFTAWWPSERLAVHGYSMEVLRRLRDIMGIRKQLRARLLQDRPDVFIGVDAPDFNLGLEADLRAAGIKTVHFVCPSIWAWRADRVEKIRRSADHVLCIFPFEPQLLAQHGIAATYVGHPLASVIPMVPDRHAARAQLGLHDGDEVLAILPGSRSAEVEYIALPFFRAAALILKARPAIKLIVPAVPALRERIEQLAHASGLGGALQIVTGQSHAVLAACDVTLIASGTAIQISSSPTDGASMARYIVGAMLMGFGSMLAGGCAVGAGMTGGAIFAVTAWLTLAGMWIGGGVADRLPSVQRPSKQLYHTAQKSQALPIGRACFIFRAGCAGSGRCCCAR